MDYRPPIILHSAGKPSNKEIPAMLDHVRKIIGLCSREYKLLLYYATCKNGFRPAKTTVAAETGIDVADIKDVRNALYKMNLIDYDFNYYYHFVFVCWGSILAYASMEQPLPVGGRGRKNMRHYDMTHYEGHPYNGLGERYLENLAWLTKLETAQLVNDDNMTSAFRHMEQIERKEMEKFGIKSYKQKMYAREQMPIDDEW